jgi:hypothetical protein
VDLVRDVEQHLALLLRGPEPNGMHHAVTLQRVST